MRRASLLLALLLATPAPGQSVKLPPEIKVKAGRLAAITVEWSGDDVAWTAAPQLDVFREYDPDPKIVRLRVIGYENGTFPLTAVVCKDKKLSPFALCNVVVGEAPPVPPGPVPPVPPEPDALAKALADAYAQDAGADKATQKAKLAELFRQLAGAEVRDGQYQTAEQLRARLSIVARSLVGDALPKLRLACWSEVIKVLPAENTPLDGKRDEVAALFLKLSDALKAVR